MSIDNFLLFYYNTHYSQIYINLHYKKGVSMQYIQQLLSRINLLYLCPFVQKILHLSLILCLVALTPMSAYAAGDSLTSSISLSFNSTKKFQLEAYEHFYAYYTMPSSYSRTKNTLSVTVSNLSNFSISVMNSDGSSISTTRKKNILYFKNNAFTAENRYFIKIHINKCKIQGFF